MNSDIKFYFELFKKRLPVMLVIFLLCAAVGVGMAMTLPPKYRANALLLVESGKLPDNLVTVTVQTRAARELQAIQFKLMTRANLIDIAAKYRVFQGQGGMSPDEVVTTMRQMTRFNLIDGGRDGTTNLRISFESGDPEIAAAVTNEYVTYVLAADVERRTGESGQTLEFFQQQVEELTRRLAEQSAQIVAYKEANNDALPEGLQFRLDRTAQLRERLNLNARDRTALVEQRNQIVAAGSRATVTPTLTPQQMEIGRLETELRSKLAIFEPDSATIQFLRRQIEILKADEVPGDENIEDGVASMLEIRLAGVDAEIRSIDEDTGNIEAELAILEASIEKTPKVGIQLDKLEREYENTQTQYAAAVSARATAEQGNDVEIAAQGERVVLIEPATAPQSPTSPNRKLIAGGGVFVGSALASMFFVLTELLNRTIRRPADLTRGLGIQPLATIPYLEEASVRRRRRIFKILFMLLAIIAIPVGLWAVHTYYLPLDLLVEKIAARVGL
ncbi:MAG: chain length-determining protein [Paracoccaceae bacterium]|nr:chain length-determining protein [Paracoccaceae bacterium]